MANGIVAILETQGGSLKKSSLEVVSEGKRLAAAMNTTLDVLVLSDKLSAVAQGLAGFGVRKVYLCENPAFAHYSAHAFLPTIEKAMRQLQPQVVLAVASSQGKDWSPRLAAKFDVGVASDCTALKWNDGRLHVRRPIFAGKAVVDFSFKNGGLMICSLRPNVFSADKADKSAALPATEALSFETPAASRATLVEVRAGQSKRADLTEADIIVSGGRSLKSGDNFKILAELAEVIGATVGASRAAVDAGYVPHSMQVGQTGKVVSPKLYMAFGISGAIQHLAGMRTSRVIVAVNSDPEAPLFKKADYGIVGDLFVIIPELTKAFKQLLH